MAFVAFVSEDGTDALLKMLQQIGRGRLGCLKPKRQNSQGTGKNFGMPTSQPTFPANNEMDAVSHDL